MNSRNFHKGLMASAAAALIPLIPGEHYALAVGFDGDDFNAFTITPYLSDGVNSGDAAQGTFTMDTQPTAGDTITIGSRTYLWSATLVIEATATLAYVLIGDTLADSKANLVAAINGTGDKDQADPLVSAAAFVADDMVLTARAAGLAGNAIATTETMTAGTNVFDAATLGTTTPGTDSYDNKLALPQIDSTDSNGSPVTFAAEGMIGFEAILPTLLLIPSGAVTSVNWAVTRRSAYSKHA